jgi:carbonic anhydrase
VYNRLANAATLNFINRSKRRSSENAGSDHAQSTRESGAEQEGSNTEDRIFRSDGEARSGTDSSSTEHDHESPLFLAAIVTCMDGRLNPQEDFAGSGGKLYYPRLAGAVISPELLGSLEIAVKDPRFAYIVLLKHPECAAEAEAHRIHKTSEEISLDLQSVIAKITPAIDDVASDAKIACNSLALGVEALLGNEAIAKKFKAGNLGIAGGFVQNEGHREAHRVEMFPLPQNIKPDYDHIKNVVTKALSPAFELFPVFESLRNEPRIDQSRSYVANR